MSLKFLAILLPIAIFCFPFINNEYLYIDDFNRASSGTYAWTADGRPFADLIYWIFNFGGKAIISFPYTIIISLIGFIFVIHKICENNKLGYIFCIGLTFLIVNPYFSQPMLYKYDSFIMVSAITITASCFIRHDKIWILLSVPLLVLSIGTYQTSLLLYIVLSCLEFVYTRKLGERYSLKLISRRILIVILSFFIYKLLLLFIKLSNYAEIHAKTIFSGSPEQFIQNVRGFIALMNSATSSFKLSTIVIVLLITSITSITIDSINNRNKEYIYRYSIILMGCSFISFASCFGGLSLLLLNPVFEPRVMTASYISAFYLIITSTLIFKDRVGLILVGALSLFSFYVSSAISFAYKEQSKFNDNIYRGIIEITNADVIYSSYFIGQPRKSQFVELIEHKIPMSEKINFFYFNNDLFSDTTLIYHGVKSYTKNNFHYQDSPPCEKRSENAFVKACVSGKNLFVRFK
ncbi:glucosyltransferase domain-containing protein [Pantoea sp.]|uniref:glucosyltransferase domain-containing protein n=1 Tax=Pantoea sp. TaxID=69393 RepID=UPI002915945D|nr:glucosyltransferase domain-containing protein [Pantoea sp.]MDU4126553.1 glucosyltransferase domain-containing protein [Pantoea sp.]